MDSQMQSEDRLAALWEAACISYGEETGTRLTSPDFPKISTPSELSSQLDSEKENFADFRLKKRPLFHSMQTVLSPFENFGDIISGAVSIAFPPASTIMGAMLLRDIPLNDGMRGVIVRVLVTSLRVCAVSQGLLSRGSFKTRISKWAKNILVEDTSVQGLLAELEKLTGQEHKMVSAHNLTLTSQAIRNTEALLEKREMENEKERISRLKTLLDPVSASGQVYSAINEGRIPNSGKWIEGRIREWWNSAESLLWIHGGPSVGKSYLASKIISDLAQTGDAHVASFFCKNNDVDLRSFNKILRTLAWQVVVQSSTFAVHAEDFCLKGDPDNTHMVWRKLLLDYFALQSDEDVCFIIDGIDEADPNEQEQFFSLLENTYAGEMDQKPHIRVVLIGRDSIGGLLAEHSLEWIHDIEINNHQNKDDLHHYVANSLQKSKLFRNASDFQDEVVKGICAQAEGLWEWANLVMKNISRCRTREQIRRVVKSMPKGITAMLDQELQRLAKELSASDTTSDDEAGSQIDQLNIILSFVTLAQRPLTVESLNLILEVLLGEEVLNLEDDLRHVYSSLFSLRILSPEEDEDEEYLGAAVVTLRHSSFYEFFESSSVAVTGPVHVNPEQAGADFLYVLLYAMVKRKTPSGWALHPLHRYAHKYLPRHLEESSPGTVATDRQRDISSLFTDLLGNELVLESWIVDPIHDRAFSEHNFHASSQISTLGQHWWNCKDRDTANHRANIVLNWLVPHQRKLLEEAAGSRSCAFGILFSRMMRSCAYLWLSPEEIDEGDGLPAALSALLFAYNEITTTSTATEEPNKLTETRFALRADHVIQVAESQGLPKNAMWHARIAQALLCHCNPEEAVGHFQIALDECEKTDALSKKSLSVIHKDMARACKGSGRHKEALEHLKLAISMADKAKDSTHDPHDHIAEMLDTAHMEFRVGMIDKAVSTAERAWEEFVTTTSPHSIGTMLVSFFVTFLELRQVHRLRSVWALALERSEDIHTMPIKVKGIKLDNFALFLIDAFTTHARIMHSVLHYVLTWEDTEQLDLIISIQRLIKHEDAYVVTDMGFYIASVLFEKRRTGDAVHMWYTVTTPKAFSGWWTEAIKIRSISRLAAVCLYNPEVPFCGDDHVVLTDESFFEVALVVFSWLQNNGDNSGAQRLISEIVRRCIALLSDDDPRERLDVFATLFNASLLTTDNDEDVRAALYLHEEAWKLESNEPEKDHDTKQGTQEDLPGSLAKAHLADDQTTGQDQELDDGQAVQDEASAIIDGMIDCFICKRETSSTNQWYFCRSCPFTALCRTCYRDIQEKRVVLWDHPHGFTGKCSTEHRFFYTGKAPRKAERPEMLPLAGSDGQKEVFRVDEWNERLLKKWKCTETDGTGSFEGGLSKWFMQTLPDTQKERWATFFKV